MIDEDPLAWEAEARAFDELIRAMEAEGHDSPEGTARLLCSIWGSPTVALAELGSRP